MIKFFTSNVKTLEDLRTEYKKLIFKHHPDVGGKTEDMQKINAEYEELLQKVGNVRKAQDGTTYTKAEYTAENDRFREIIEKLINFNVSLEICGSWLWIGNGYAYREELKKAGCFWCSGKKLWAWTDEPTNNKHKLTMDEIRKAHGSEIIKTAEQKQIEAA